MKKFSVLVLCAMAFIAAQAQHPINSFFAPDGTVRLETQELNEAADSIVTIFHRTEDIVWRRDIYRVIDMRQKQNFQLYFPLEPDDPNYMSLFRTITDAVQHGLTIYRRNDNQQILKPNFSAEQIYPREEVKDAFMAGGVGELDRDDENSFLLMYDSTTNQMIFRNYSYERYVRNQIKYLVYEVVFFSKATSRMYRKIISIAPLQPDQVQGAQDEPASFMRQSVKFWVLFDELRPYLAAKYIIPTKNETKRITFDEFFQKRMFSSYIIGEGNIYNRMILDYCKTEKEAKQEQARIEYELLTFEQDLWEY